MEAETRAELLRMARLIETNAKQLGELMDITKKIIETQQILMREGNHK